MCWEENGNQYTPPEGTFSYVSPGRGDYACGVKTDGSLICWGGGPDSVKTHPKGPLTSVSAGYGGACWVDADAAVACLTLGVGEGAPPGGEFDSVSAGGGHTCGVKTDGSVECWGGSTPPAGEFDSVSVGRYRTCGVKTDGSLVCWGERVYGLTSPGG